MNNIRHIHEVLEILFTTSRQYNVQNLQTDLADRFGDDVSFMTCADNIFGISEVVPFLLSKNKIRLEGSEIIPLVPACSH